MKIRAELLRVLLATMGLAMLILPVGVQTASGIEVVSIPEALGQLATGHLGVGLLSAFVAGGAAASGALVRLGLCIAAWIGFLLAGRLRPRAEPTERERHYICDNCGFVTARRMQQCPSCGHPIT